MTKAEEYKIMDNAIKKYGTIPQICMVFEEMAELQKELCKRLRGSENIDHIAEEIADVEIMLDQMKLIFSVFSDVDEWREKKLKRLKERLEDDRA